MEELRSTCASLRAQIAETEALLAALKCQLASAENAAAALADNGSYKKPDERIDGQQTLRRWPLLAEEYRRYGRQMIVPQIGLQGSYLCHPFDLFNEPC